jgi:hypothetical protein
MYRNIFGKKCVTKDNRANCVNNIEITRIPLKQHFQQINWLVYFLFRVPESGVAWAEYSVFTVAHNARFIVGMSLDKTALWQVTECQC